MRVRVKPEPFGPIKRHQVTIAKNGHGRLTEIDVKLDNECNDYAEVFIEYNPEYFGRFVKGTHEPNQLCDITIKITGLPFVQYVDETEA